MIQIRRARVLLPLGTFLMCVLPAAIHATPSLVKMVAAAAARNPGMELADAERGIAGALQRKADQPFAGDPIANVKYQTDSVGSDNGYREWEGGIELPLWLPGQSDSYAREAERTVAVSDSINDARRLEIAGKVRERLWAVAIARSEAEQAQSALEVAKSLLQDIQRRVEAGELPRSDSLLAEKELLQREEAMQLASNRVTQTERLFTRFTGLDAPREAAREQPGGTGLNAEHPRLQLAQRHVAQAQAHRDRIRSESRSGPNLWLGAKSVKPEAGYDYDSSVGVELSMPFGNGAHSAPDLAEAELALTRAQVELNSALLELEDALTQASLELDRAKASLKQTKRRRTLSDESLKLSRRAFDLGETDLVRLLQAQADALAARQDEQIRQLEYGQTVARLNQALGVIPR